MVKRRRTNGDWVTRSVGMGNGFAVPMTIVADSSQVFELVPASAVAQRNDDITVDRVIIEYIVSRGVTGGDATAFSLGVRKWPTTTLFAELVTLTPVPAALDPYTGSPDEQWLIRRTFVLPTGNVFFPTPEGGATEPFSAVMQSRVRTRLKGDDRLLLVICNYTAGGGPSVQFRVRSSCYVLS